MRVFLTIGLLLTVCVSLFGQEMPDWVKQRPVSSLYYIGIGRAPKTDANYMQTAKQNALKDLASELKVQVSSNSLLQTIEGQSGEVDSRFQETVKVSVCEDLEKFHLAGTWQDDESYWVYYELSIIDYEEYITKRKQDATSQGYAFWQKGDEALQAGDLMPALEFWVKGLQAVQSVMNEELPCLHNGRQIDVACELYAAVKNAFAGVVLSADTVSVTAQAYRPVERPVGLTLTRQMTPLKNVALRAAFVQGDGKLSREIRTDDNGQTRLYIENVTASLPRQQVKVEISDEPFRPLLNGVFGGLVKEVLVSAPRALIRISLVEENMRACLRAESDADAAVVRAVKDVLTRNRFIVVENPDQADVEIRISGTCRKGEKQQAGLSAMAAWYASVSVSMVKREGGVVLLEYVPEEIRVLQAEFTSEAAAKRKVVGELTKLLNRQLPGRLKEIYR